MRRGNIFRRTFVFVTVFGLWLLFSSWGYTGHWNISDRASYFMPASLLSYTHWADSLSSHASDADARKAWDSDESPRHYVDLENFPGFLGTGRVVQTVDSAYLVYGSTFLRYNGSLPWRTLVTFDSLKSAFERNDLHDVIYYASDLGHYVGDGHMPMHLTANYDGQLTNQDGVHYRLETRLINTYISQINYSGESISFISDVNVYVFQYVYNNFLYVDSLLYGDSIAYAQTGAHSGSAYYSALWLQCGGQMQTLFKNASKSLAELIYTAWVMAGSPDIIMTNSSELQSPVLFPVPASDCFWLRFPTDYSGIWKIRIVDIQGKLVYEDETSETLYSIQSRNFSPGSYYIFMESAGQGFLKKAVVVH